MSCFEFSCQFNAESRFPQNRTTLSFHPWMANAKYKNGKYLANVWTKVFFFSILVKCATFSPHCRGFTWLQLGGFTVDWFIILKVKNISPPTLWPLDDYKKKNSFFQKTKFYDQDSVFSFIICARILPLSVCKPSLEFLSGIIKNSLEPFGLGNDYWGRKNFWESKEIFKVVC